MKTFISILVLSISIVIGGCSGLVKEKAFIDMKINPADTGWYFLELVQDSTNAVPQNTEIQFDTSYGLPHVPVNGIQNYSFRVFGRNGEMLSKNARMAAFVYHTAGHQYYRFYNPSASELQNEQNWNPRGPYMEALKEKSVLRLNELLKK